VLCSHGPVIPQIISAAAQQGGAEADVALRRSAALATGEFTVLHFAAETDSPQLVAVETHSPSTP
jgi:8-oxo-dGTP diphosphatase